LFHLPLYALVGQKFPANQKRKQRICG
jgi:hypothetical protein